MVSSSSLPIIKIFFFFNPDPIGIPVMMNLNHDEFSRNPSHQVVAISSTLFREQGLRVLPNQSLML